MNKLSKLKPLEWISSSRKDMKEMPEDVRRVFGVALYIAQTGGKHVDAKPLKGFGGSGVLEVVEDYDGNAYRAIYTVRFVDALYVLHVFQKKSKAGIATPQAEIDKIKVRLKMAEEMHQHRGRK